MRVARIRAGAACVLLGALIVPALSEVFTYEGNTFPESGGWERIVADTPGADRTLDNGWLVLFADLPDGWTKITGDADLYRVSLTDFVDAERFFVEWRAVTDNPSWLLDKHAGPTVASAAGRAASLYQARFTDSAAQFLRDLDIPRVITPVSVGIAHVYRVEVEQSQSYAWYIDGKTVDSGIPEGPYPDPDAFLIWGVRRWYVDATTAWDYVRFGRIPEDASGDYDSDGAITDFDYYFVHDCLSKDGPGIFGGPDQNAGPGCRFADFDGNDSVDLFDFAEFQNLHSGPRP